MSTEQSVENSLNPHKTADEWRQNLKAGDEVILYQNMQESIRSVVRVTPKQVFINAGDIKEYECGFWKKDGYKVGGSTGFSSAYLIMPDERRVQAIRDKLELKELQFWMDGQRFNIAEMRAIKAAVLDVRKATSTS